MNRRFKLQEEFEALINSKNVYFQPPEGFKMGYPCIVYELSKISSIYADNRSYKLYKSFTVTYITDNPDDELIEGILHRFKMISFDRQFKYGNMYHNMYTLYY